MSGVLIEDWMDRNWRRSCPTSAGVKPVERRRSNPRGAGVVFCPNKSLLLLSLEEVSTCRDVDAAAASAASSSAVRISPIEQLMYTRVGTGSMSIALPLPLGSGGGRGGGGGTLITDGRREASGNILPPYIRRRRREEVGADSFVRIRCVREMTVVLEGRDISRARSGIEVVNRMVIRRGLTGATAGKDAILETSKEHWSQ